MRGKEAAARLLAEAGPLIDAVRIAASGDGLAWSIDFEGDETPIDIAFDEVVERLVVTADIGTVPQHAAQRLHGLMLAYNYLWTAHGGLRTAVDAASGRAALLLDVPAAGLDLVRLCAVLANLRSACGAWRRVLQAAEHGDDALDAGRMPGMGTIRV